MGKLRVLFAAAAALSIPGACATTGPDDGDEHPVLRPGLDDDFAAAAAASGVPADLLAAIAFVETRWQMVLGEEEIEGRPAGAGLFGLWGDNLTRGAAAAGVDAELARTDVDANIAAAAARLAELARDRGVAGDDLAAWQPVVGDFAQAMDPEPRAAYTGDVYAVLVDGASAVMEDGTPIATIAPHRELAGLVLNAAPVFDAANTDYDAAIWRSSPNYNARPAGYNVSLVVIHTCEGNYAGCWGWLRNTAASASAHYVVKENGSEITQLVREANRAWHVAAAYECSRAGNQQCNRNGASTNHFSVGIEHAGFASQASFPTGQLQASAELTCDITRDHGVPRDRNHIVSHGQLQPWNRTDPGPNWPWNDYIDRVRTACGEGGGGGGGGGGTIVVDSNNANNDAAVARIELTGTWTSSSSTSGYYGSGYWYAQTEAVSAPATFWFYLPAAGTRSIDAWWTAGTNRSAAATFVAFDAGGSEKGRKSVDQRSSGSQWVTLGTWNFSAGWNKVTLSRWAAAGSVVIADAIRVR